MVGALFLNIKAAFPSVVLEHLLHGMWKRGIPREYTEWIRRKVTNRTTRISFDDFRSSVKAINCGIDQGCPISGILFIFYNADLLDITNKKNGEDSLAVVDDTTLLATGADLAEAFGKLEQIMTRENGALDWSLTHKCRFALNKFGLMGFTRKRETAHSGNKKTRPIMRPTINLPGQTILPSTSHKFLGVLLDQELRFKEQAAYALDKGTKWTEQYRRLAKGTNGISAKHMTVFYFTIALPKMLYTADLFLITGSKKTKGMVGFINKLARVHRQALLSITGAMNTTAMATLEAHANIPPF